MSNVIPVIKIEFPDHAVELEMVRNGVTKDKAFWKGEAVLVAFDEIRDYPLFLRAIDRVLVGDDFGGLLMGQGSQHKHKFELVHLTVTRWSLMSIDDQTRFGPDATALINMQYKIIWQTTTGGVSIKEPRVYQVESGE